MIGLDSYVHLQHQLCSLNEDNPLEISNSVERCFISSNDGLNSLVHEMFFLTTVKIGVIDHLVMFTVYLMERNEDGCMVSKLPFHILRNLPRCKHISNVLFALRLLRAGIIKSDETLVKILSISEQVLPQAREIFAEEFYKTYPLFFPKPRVEKRDEYEDGCKEGTIHYALKYDDLELFQSISSSPLFDFNHSVELPMLYHTSVTERKATLIEIAAMFGSIRCFKFLILNHTEFRGFIEVAPIIGGNTEIIRVWDRAKPLSFRHIETALLFRHNDVVGWILENKPCVWEGEKLIYLSLVTNNAAFFKQNIENVSVTSHTFNTAVSNRAYFSMSYLIRFSTQPLSLVYAGNINDSSIIDFLISMNPKGHYSYDLSAVALCPEVFDSLLEANIIHLNSNMVNSILKKGTYELISWIYHKNFCPFTLEFLRTSINSRNYEVSSFLVNLPDIKIDLKLLLLVLETVNSKKSLIIPFVETPRLDITFIKMLENYPYLGETSLSDRALVENWYKDVNNFTPDMAPYLALFYICSEPCISTDPEPAIYHLKKSSGSPDVRKKTYDFLQELSSMQFYKSYHIPLINFIGIMALDDITEQYTNENIINNDSALKALSAAIEHGTVSSDVLKRCKEVQSAIYSEKMLRIAFSNAKIPNFEQCSMLYELFSSIEELAYDEKHNISAIKTLSMCVPAMGHCFPFEVASLVSRILSKFSESSSFLQSILSHIEDKTIGLCEREILEVQEVLDKRISILIEKDSKDLSTLSLCGLGEKFVFHTSFDILKRARLIESRKIAIHAIANALSRKWPINTPCLDWFFSIEVYSDYSYNFFEIATSLIRLTICTPSKDNIDNIIKMFHSIPREHIASAMKMLGDAIENIELREEVCLSLLDLLEMVPNPEENNVHFVLSILLTRNFNSLKDQIQRIIKLLDDVSQAKEKRFLLVCFLPIARNIINIGYDEKLFKLFSRTIKREPAIHAHKERRQKFYQTDSYYFESEDNISSLACVDGNATEMDFILVGVISAFAAKQNLRKDILERYQSYLSLKAQDMPSARRLLQILE